MERPLTFAVARRCSPEGSHPFVITSIEVWTEGIVLRIGSDEWSLTWPDVLDQLGVADDVGTEYEPQGAATSDGGVAVPATGDVVFRGRVPDTATRLVLSWRDEPLIYVDLADGVGAT